MSESIQTAGSRQAIETLADQGDLVQIEQAWLDLIDDPPTDPMFYKKVVDAFIGARKRDTPHELMVMILDEFQKRSEWRLMDRIISRVVTAWPDSPQMRAFAEKALRGRYARLSNIDEMIEACGIAKEDEILVTKAIKRFRALLRLCPGQVYQHATWGEGVIQSMDIRARKIVFDFPKEKGKTITFDGVKKFLVYLSPSHFLARRARDLEKLSALAGDNPVELIKLALESHDGAMKQAQLKAWLAGSIIPVKSWTSWWTRARKTLALDPLVDIDPTGGAHAEVVLRDKPKTVEEEIRELFFTDGPTFTRRIDALERLTEARKRSTPYAPELPREMLKRLDEDYMASMEPSPAVVLEYAFLCKDLRQFDPDLGSIVTSIPDPSEAIGSITEYEELNEIESVTIVMRALELLFERDGEKGKKKAARLLPKAPVRLAQAIWRELNDDRHREQAAEALQVLVNEPLRNPPAYLWASRMLIEDHEELAEYFPLSGTVLDLLSGIETWKAMIDSPSNGEEIREAANQLFTKCRALLSARNYGALCKAAEQMPLDQAQRLVRTIENHPALNESFIAGAVRQLLLTRRDLNENSNKDSDASQSEAILCTARSREDKTREMRELRTEKIPANSRAIELAREEGDLKENAGYHAAKDEQKIMMQKVLQLQEGLGGARVVTADDVKTDSVCFGTSIEIENLSDQRIENYTILGRWEADPDRNIISIQAPIAAQFLGHKPGETLVVSRPDGGETQYKLLSIANALASGEWDVKKDE